MKVLAMQVFELQSLVPGCSYQLCHNHFQTRVKLKMESIIKNLLIFSETGGGPTDDERIFGRDGFPIVGLPPALSSELQISESREVFAVIF